jgi:hypothetical protein
MGEERRRGGRVVFFPQVGDARDWLQNTTAHSLAPLTDSFAPISDRRKSQQESHESDIHLGIYLKLGILGLYWVLEFYCY